MNIFEFALNGISAIADALSITPTSVKPVAKQVNSVRARVAKITKRGRTTKPVAQATPTQAPVTLPPLIPVPVHTKHVRHAVNNAIDPHLTPDQVRLLNGVRQTMPPDHLQVLNDVRQALIEERLAEMAEMRKEQEQQLNQQPGNRLKP